VRLEPESPFTPERHVRNLGIGILLVAMAAPRGGAAQQSSDSYEIAYAFEAKTPASHIGTVSLQASGPLADTVEIQMPAWYPGRYAIYHFAANVLDAQATCNGHPVPSPRIDQQTWLVRCPGRRRLGGSTLVMTWHEWWNDLSGSTSQIDSLHINLNPGTIFPYVVGHKADPVTVTYAGPAGWSVMNGAVFTAPAGTVRQSFQNYDVFIDTPTEISARFTLDTFSFERTQYRLLIHAEGDTGMGMRERLRQDLRKLVATDVALWGEQPMERYLFLAHYIPGNRGGGDGMEHLTSTQVITAGSLGDTANYLRRLESYGHEFFHSWNMKRLRARELGPWDYTRENYTTTLWVGEGWTNYYGARTVYRAGLWDRARYRARVAGNIAYLQQTPGRLVMSAEEASLSAWFMDRVPLRQQTDLSRSSIDYYTKGEALAWLLDLEVRARTSGAKTLDDVLRLLWQRCWKGANASYYLQGRGYTDADVLQALNDVSGTDFSDFFKRYVAGVEELPYGVTLSKVGLRLMEDGGGQGPNVLRIEADSTAPEPTRQLGAAWLEGR